MTLTETRKKSILTSLEIWIARANTHYHRASSTIHSMAIDKEEYRKAWEVMMRNKFASTFLQIIRQIVACSPSDNAAENIIRFHAHQLATFGTTNCNDVTSLAQRQVAKVLNHIIMYIIKDNEI